MYSKTLVRGNAVYQVKVQICADDFGMSPGINDAILDLVEKDIVGSVSIMPVFQGWEKWAPKLMKLRKEKGLKIGLHTCFTGTGIRPILNLNPATGLVNDEGKFLTPGQLYFRLISKIAKRKSIASELKAQFESLQKVIGRIDHIDSHHHVHQWPMISNEFLNFAEEFSQILIRHTMIPNRLFAQNLGWKSVWLNFNGRNFCRKLNKKGLQVGPYFSTVFSKGKYSLNKIERDFQKANSGFENIVWICHPAKNIKDLSEVDSLLEERVLEYKMLLSKIYINSTSESTYLLK